jgi:hypothetical protein
MTDKYTIEYIGADSYDGEWAQQGSKYTFKATGEDGETYDVEVYDDSVDNHVFVIWGDSVEFDGFGRNGYKEFKEQYPDLDKYIGFRLENIDEHKVSVSMNKQGHIALYYDGGESYIQVDTEVEEFLSMMSKKTRKSLDDGFDLTHNDLTKAEIETIGEYI